MLAWGFDGGSLQGETKIAVGVPWVEDDSCVSVGTVVRGMLRAME